MRERNVYHYDGYEDFHTCPFYNAGECDFCLVHEINAKKHANKWMNDCHRYSRLFSEDYWEKHPEEKDEDYLDAFAKELLKR